MADWEKLGGWDKEGPNLTRKGGGPVFAPSAGEPGHYSFSIKVIKGKRAEWFTNFVDDRNNVLFQLDDDHLTITTVVDGAKKTIKPSFHINREDWVMISMDVSDSSISINVIQQDKKLSASVPAGHPTGKFAFRVPGKDEIEVSDFHFVPR
jgi:predicted DNA-binding protein (MmcQ/YjbR family)